MRLLLLLLYAGRITTVGLLFLQSRLLRGHVIRLFDRSLDDLLLFGAKRGGELSIESRILL